jgi:hypothetical protein
MPLTHFVILRNRSPRIKTNNPIVKIICPPRWRMGVAGVRPGGRPALILAAARLRHIANAKCRMRAPWMKTLLQSRHGPKAARNWIRLVAKLAPTIVGTNNFQYAR